MKSQIESTLEPLIPVAWPSTGMQKCLGQEINTMLTAKEFWTTAKREELSAYKLSSAARSFPGYIPDRLHRMGHARPTGPLIVNGAHEGFVFHEKWPEGMNYMRSCRKGGDREAQRALDHNGWYTDSFYDGVIYACAVEIRVPRRRAKREGVESESIYTQGQPTRVRWVEATEHSGWDQILISRRDIHDDLRDAILGADGTAEYAAEEEREYEAKDLAQLRIDELEAEIKESEGIVAPCRAQLETLCESHETARTVIIERIADEEASITKAKAKIESLKADPWSAVR